VSGIGGRIFRAWRALPPERRLAACAALALFVTLFLPWYQETVITAGVGTKFALPSASLTGWAAFSFVEAAVLVVALSVLVLLFVRAEGRAFHVPGGDGGVIFAAGAWTGVLVLWRMFDKSSTTGHGAFVTTSGIEWGIFITLGVAGLLAYSGSRIKLAHEPEPPLPGERVVPGPRPAGGRGRKRTPRPVRAGDTPRSEAETGWLTPERPRRPRAAPDALTHETLPGPGPAPRSDPGAGPSPDHDAEAPTRPRRAADDKLNFSDLDAIEFDEPPEAPTIRQARTTREAPTVRRLPGPDDQLTMRLDRPQD
jgi:hypothetical protein